MRARVIAAGKRLDGNAPDAAADRWQLVILRAVIVAVVGGVFFHVTGHDFVLWDDLQLIYQNPNLNPPTLQGLWNHWRAPHEQLYIPVVYTAWWLIALIADAGVADPMGTRLNPYIFHAANLIVHAANALIVFEILRRLVKNAWAAGIGALLFAVHPVQVEAVAWATGMKDLLCGFFSLLAVWSYMSWRREDGGWRYWCATAAFCAAMLCKPSAVTLPIMLAAMDRWAIGRRWGEVTSALWIWMALSVPVMIGTAIVQPAATVQGAPLWERPLVAGDALAFYLAKIAWPAKLAGEYGRTPQAILASGQVWWTWGVPAALAILIIAGQKRPLWAAGAVFIAPLAPVLGLVTFSYQQYSTVADRYLYVSMAAVGWIVAWGLNALAGRGNAEAQERAGHRWAGLLAGVAIVWVVVLSVRSFFQIGYWAEDRVFFEHVLAVNPRSYAAELNLGATFQNVGDLPNATVHYRRAIEIRPGYTTAILNLADILISQKRYAAAVGPLEAALEAEDQHKPDMTGLHQRLAALFLGLGRGSDAEREFRIVLGRYPNKADAVAGLQQAKTMEAKAATQHASTTRAGN